MPRGMIEILCTSSSARERHGHQRVPQLVVRHALLFARRQHAVLLLEARRSRARPPPAAPPADRSRSRRTPSSAASLTMLARSAPTKPAVIAAITSRSASRSSATWRACTLRIVESRHLVGAIDEDLAVEAPGAQQRRVEDLRAIGGGHEDHADARIEAVQLDQQLVQRLLALLVRHRRRGRAPCPARPARR